MIIMLRDPHNPNNLIVSSLYCSILSPVCLTEMRIKSLGSLTHYFWCRHRQSFFLFRSVESFPSFVLNLSAVVRQMISSRVGLTTMWIYPIIESIACYFMILDFVPSPVQTTLISHKNTILWPQVENFMPFFQTTERQKRRDFPEI